MKPQSITILFFLSCLFASGTAQGTTFSPAKEKEVFRYPANKGKRAQALQRVTNKLSQIRSLQASFTQRKKLKALRFPLVSVGFFQFSQSKGIKWQLMKPFPAKFVITPTKITQEVNGKVTHIEAKKKPILYGFTQMFLSIFSGKHKQLAQHFALFFVQNKHTWTIGLQPKNKMLRRIFKAIVLTGKQSIEHVSLYERSGDTTFLQFKAIKLTQNPQPNPTTSPNP